MSMRPCTEVRRHIRTFFYNKPIDPEPYKPVAGNARSFCEPIMPPFREDDIYYFVDKNDNTFHVFVGANSITFNGTVMTLVPSNMRKIYKYLNESKFCTMLNGPHLIAYGNFDRQSDRSYTSTSYKVFTGDKLCYFRRLGDVEMLERLEEGRYNPETDVTDWPENSVEQ